MASAAELFASRGHEAQMEEIAARCGLGMGTLYRHFPSKQALLTAMVRERFHGMADLARAAEQISDPGESFETLLRSYLEAAEGDASFQLALMGAGDVEWAGIKQEKDEFGDVASRIIERAVAARGGTRRPDLPGLHSARPRGHVDHALQARRELRLAPPSRADPRRRPGLTRSFRTGHRCGAVPA